MGVLNRFINIRFYSLNLLPNLINRLLLFENSVNHYFKIRSFKQIYKLVRMSSSFLIFVTLRTCLRKKYTSRKYVSLNMCFIGEISEIADLCLYIKLKNPILLKFHFDCLEDPSLKSLLSEKSDCPNDLCCDGLSRIYCITIAETTAAIMIYI